MRRILSSILKCLVLFILLVGITLAGIVIVAPTLIKQNQFSNWVSNTVSETIGREVKLQGPINLSYIPELTLDIENFSIKNPESQAKEKMLSIKDFQISIPYLQNPLAGLQISSIKLAGVKARVTEDSSGTSNWNFENKSQKKSTSPNQSFSDALLPTIHKLQIKDASLFFNSGKEVRNIKISQIEGNNIGLNSKNSLSTNLIFNDAPFVFKINLDTLNNLLAGEDAKFDIDLKQDDTSIKIDGTLTKNGKLDVAVDFAGDDLSKLSGFFSQKLPSIKNYSLKSQVISTPKKGTGVTIKFNNIEFETEENDLSGSLKVDTNPLMIEGDLESDFFNLMQVTQSASQSEKKQDSLQSQNGPKGDPEIPFDSFNLLDANLKVKAKKFVTFLGLELDNLDFAASLNDGALDVEKFVAEAFSGNISGQLTASNKALSTRIKAENLNVNPISELSGGKTLIDGKFNLLADLNASGTRLSEILSSLNGDLKLTSENANLKGSKVRAFSSGLFEIFSPLFREDEKKPSECLLINFHVENGIAKSKEQVVKVGQVFLFGEGTLDFIKNTINYHVHVNSKNPSLASLIPPFKATGRLAAPNFFPSLTGTVASIADSTEGLATSALGLVGDTAGLLFNSVEEKYEGLELCENAYEAEQNLISSRVSAFTQ